MTEAATPQQARWADACLAAQLCATDPVGLGAVLRGPHGGASGAWLGLLRALLPPTTPWRRLPPNVPDSRLLGGLDLAASLGAGRPVAERGLLAEADGGLLIAPMAERLPAETAARLAAVLDSGEVVVERDGLALRLPARIGLVLLDEGSEPDETPAAALQDRLALLLDLAGLRPGPAPPPDPEAILAARAALPLVRVPEDALEALCTTALALGVWSLRVTVLALRAARAAAALAGRTLAAPEDVALAARVVLAPRATRIPATEQEEQEAEPPPPEPEDSAADEEDRPAPPQVELAEQILEAALAALPPDLLAALAKGASPKRGASGKAGQATPAQRRGRPAGVRAGALTPGARLNLVETLRAAAPWQRLRRVQAPPGAPAVLVRRADFRIQRFKERTGSTTIFVVDASGSSALGRLAEAKGAVELLLAECYVRRDQVAVIGFRGPGAALLLPPTSSLVRAKRALAGLPGGGGTPLASAVEAATLLALAERRRGRLPAVLLLTDGRANVARDGTGGRPRADADAMAASRAFAGLGVAAMVVDTSPRPQPEARRIAEAMAARYLPLPQADGQRLSNAARALVPA